MKDTIGSLNSLGSDAVRGSQQTVKAEVTSVGEKAKKGKDFDKKCDAVEIIDIKDETSPRKFTSVEVEDTIELLVIRILMTLKLSILERNLICKTENCVVRELNCW